MTQYILAGYLAITSPQGFDNPTEEAIRHIAKATYIATELDRNVYRIEKKYLNLAQYPQLGYIGYIARVVTEKRVTYRWEF